MCYVSRCTANRGVFNADLKLSMFSVWSRRESGNEFQNVTLHSPKPAYMNVLAQSFSRYHYHFQRWHSLTNPSKQRDQLLRLRLDTMIRLHYYFWFSFHRPTFPKHSRFPQAVPKNKKLSYR